MLAALPAAAECEDIATPAEWGYSPTLSLLGDGRVLLAGGRHHDGHDFLARAEILDLTTRELRPVAAMSVRRAMHTAISLPDGRVLVAGEAKPVEVYDLKSDRWTKIGVLKTKATGVAVVLTPGKKVLIVVGDIGWKGVLSNEAMLWDLKGKLQTAQSGDAFAGQAFVTRKHGVLFFGYQDDDSFTVKLWTRNLGTGELAPFERDRGKKAATRVASAHGAPLVPGRRSRAQLLFIGNSPHYSASFASRPHRPLAPPSRPFPAGRGEVSAYETIGQQAERLLRPCSFPTELWHLPRAHLPGQL